MLTKENAANHLVSLRLIARNLYPLEGYCTKNQGAAKLATCSGSDSPRAIPSFSALLGCVKWQKG
jgi:hypothetical protein